MKDAKDHGLYFDEEKHVYYYDGLIVPGVTTVLSDVGISDLSKVPVKNIEKAAKRGSMVHLTCEYHDNEILDIAPLKTAGYFEQYLKFLIDYDVEMIDVESKIFCKKYRYAGTLDRVAILHKISDKPVMFDIKTCARSRSHQIQTAAYEYAYRKDKRKKMDRYTLRLTNDKYVLQEVNNSRLDFDVFISALNVYNYKKENK